MEQKYVYKIIKIQFLFKRSEYERSSQCDSSLLGSRNQWWME